MTLLSDLLQQEIHDALQVAFDRGALGELAQCPPLSAVGIEKPKNPDHGDYATPVALSLSKAAKRPPRNIAEALVQAADKLNLSIAGPGFINIRLSDQCLATGLTEILTEGANYGRTIPERAEKILLEFVSANPTGPLHVGHGRWAALGSAIANLLEFAGHQVTKEFYINDAGNQMDLLGVSLRVRYLQALGEDVAMPENGYQGQSIKDMAQQLLEQQGNQWRDQPETTFREFAYQQVLAQQKQILAQFQATFDNWFSERQLHSGGDDSAIAEGLRALEARGFLYRATAGAKVEGAPQAEETSTEEATFFHTIPFGDDKDRVVVRSDGRYTYMAADIAYHKNKLDRGYDRLINILGADHHGYVPRLQAIVQAYGYSPQTLEVIIGQLVKLYRLNPATGHKEEVRMSKRTGTGVTVDDLVYGLDSPEDAVGVDAARWYLLSQSPDSQVTFDLDLAVAQKEENLVYYAQYSHARTCSLERRLQEKGVSAPPTFSFCSEEGKLLLQDKSERALMLALLSAPEVYRFAANERAPHKVVVYVAELARLFNKFYAECPLLPVLAENPALAFARWGLFRATGQVLRNSLQLLGISSPEAM